MKKYLNYVFIVLLFLGQQSYADIIATTAVTYTSLNPKVHSGANEADMLKLSLSDVMSLVYSYFDQGILANATGGEVRLKVYYYRADAIDGKRMLLYESSTNESNSAFVHQIEAYYREDWQYPIDPKDGAFWDIGRYGWASDDIKTAAIKAAEDYQGYHNCWQNWNTEACGWHRGMAELVIPIIIEVTMHHATLHKFKIPALGEFDPAILAKIPPVSIKGTNYEVTRMNNSATFGHAENRFTINEKFLAGLAGKSITGLYDNGSSPDSYFKVNMQVGTTIWVALEDNQSISNTPFINSWVEVLHNAFEIKKGDLTKTFSVYRIISLADRVFKFTANESGPFIIADNFDVSFKEDLALPANKRKLFHRQDHLNDVLVCAHRGLWSKVGRHDTPDYSGIAENTIPAYDLAINDPDIDWIEFDARRTSDGVFVAWHDEGISRVSSFPDNQECIPIDEVNARDKLWRDEHQPTYAPANLSLKNKTWDFMKDLHLRDYLGCKVKDQQGNYMHPLKLEDGFAWLKDQKTQGKHSVISVDYKDGKYHLDEVYELILKYDLEGQVLLSVYAKDYSLADYQAEYGKDFLKQIPLKPTFYEPVNIATDYGGNVLARFNEYINAPEHFVAGFTLNVNYDQDDLLIDVLEQPGFPAIANRVWYMSHYNEPFMASITDNNRLNTTADCDPTQHPLLQLCSNLFWRADFDWLLNNGTNAIFSDNTESLIEYLKAKGKKQP